MMGEDRIKRACLIKLVIFFALTLIVAAPFCLPSAVHAATASPERVTVIKATADYDSVTLTWKASENATDYIIYRSKYKYGIYRQIGTTAATTYIDKKLETGKAQWYKIRALNDGKRSWKSSRISAVPKLDPPVLTAEAAGEGVYLKLEKVEGADGYVIYRDGKSLSTQKTLTYLDSDIYTGKKHKYKAIAYRFVERKEVVPSEFSREVAATRPSMDIHVRNTNDIPEEIHEGESFEFKGKVTSNTTIKKIVVGIAGREDGKWVKGFKFTDNEVNEMDFDLKEANEKIKVEELPQGEYVYKVSVEFQTGFEKTAFRRDFDIIQPLGSDLILNAAYECAWPKGTSGSVYHYPGGQRTEAYTAALSQAYGSRSGWSDQTKAGASCDVFVGTVVRVSGYDPTFPRGLDEIESYCSGHSDKWLDTGITSEADMQPGDVLYQLYSGGGGHICIYLGDGLVANAHYHGKTYGVIQPMHNGGGISRHSWKTFKVYRPIQ